MKNACKHLALCTLTLILCLALAACGSSSDDGGAGDGGGRVTVAASFYPFAYAVEQVGGDLVDVDNLTSPGVEPHDLELKPQQVGAVQDADLVVIAGDIFDNEWEAVEAPETIAATLRSIRSKYGVYACYGNHDIEEPVLAGFTFRQSEKKESDPRMDEFLKDANITLLRDEGMLIDGKFYLYGRPDAHRPGRGIETRKTPDEITAGLDKDKPIIVLDHQPKELQELADAGVDIDLCGHTHDGQMFPGNLTIKLMWENACGYLQKGKMHNIVTSGVGLFGPNMRVGTKAEICPITIYFA